MKLLLILGAIYVLVKISGPEFWSGWHPPRRGKNRYRQGEKPHGLPWMGDSMKRKKSKYYWDD